MALKNNLKQAFEKQPARMLTWLFLLSLFLVLRFVHQPWFNYQNEQLDEINQSSSSIRTEASINTSSEQLKQIHATQKAVLDSNNDKFYAIDAPTIKLNVAKEIEEYSELNGLTLRRGVWKANKKLNKSTGLEGLVYSVSIRMTANDLIGFLSFVEAHKPFWFYEEYRISRRSIHGKIELQLDIMIPVLKGVTK